jgi:hypothetical protein
MVLIKLTTILKLSIFINRRIRINYSTERELPELDFCDEQNLQVHMIEGRLISIHCG